MLCNFIMLPSKVLYVNGLFKVTKIDDKYDKYERIIMISEILTK